MKRVKFIINGKRKSNQRLQSQLQRLKDEGGDFDLFFTRPDSNIADALLDNPDRVVVGGGDGTINLVVNELMKYPKTERAELAILPLGTANDFASSALIPSDIEASISLAIEGEARAIDIGKVNDRYFLNVASGGFGAMVTTQTPPALKNLLGGTAYTLTGLLKLFSFSPIEGKMVIDDFEIEGSSIATAVCNGRRAGGGMILSPEAYIDDGKFDIVLFTFDNIPVPSHLAPPSDNLFGQISFRKIFRASKVEFTPKSQMRLINLDGEPYSASSFSFEVCQKEINLVLPPESPLISKG